MTAEVKTDVNLLLECLKCQVDNPVAMKQAFLTLSAIFSDCSGEIKEYFRNLGGLDFVMCLITSITDIEVKETALFCLGCAVGNDIFSQQVMTKTNVYHFIHKVLSSDVSAARYKQAAVFLLLNLVSNNAQGQKMAKDSCCFSDLLELLRTALPKEYSPASDQDRQSWIDDVGKTSVELWSSVASTLCICLNNPQNVERQSICSVIFPYIFTLLREQINVKEITRPLISLIGFIVANNRSNQNKVRGCNALGLLCKCLYNSLKDSNNMDTGQSDDAIRIVSTIDSCVADNGENAEIIGQFGGIRLMMEMLRIPNISTAGKLRVIVSLGHAIELSEKNRQILLNQNDGLQCLVQLLSSNEDEEFTKTVKYVLQLCVNKDNGNMDSTPIHENESEARGEKDVLLLEKITELSNQLKALEEHVVNQPPNAVLNMTHTPGQQNYFTMHENNGNRQDCNPGENNKSHMSHGRATTTYDCQINPNLSNDKSRGDNQYSRCASQIRRLDFNQNQKETKFSQSTNEILDSVPKLLHQTNSNQITPTGDASTFIPDKHYNKTPVPHDCRQNIGSCAPEHNILGNPGQHSQRVLHNPGQHNQRVPIPNSQYFDENQWNLIKRSTMDVNFCMRNSNTERRAIHKQGGRESQTELDNTRLLYPDDVNVLSCQDCGHTAGYELYHSMQPESACNGQVGGYLCPKDVESCTKITPKTYSTLEREHQNFDCQDISKTIVVNTNTPCCRFSCSDLVKEHNVSNIKDCESEYLGSELGTAAYQMKETYAESRVAICDVSSRGVQGMLGKKESSKTDKTPHHYDSEKVFIKPTSAPPKGRHHGLFVRRARSLGSTDSLVQHKKKIIKYNSAHSPRVDNFCVDTQSEFDFELMRTANKRLKIYAADKTNMNSDFHRRQQDSKGVASASNHSVSPTRRTSINNTCTPSKQKVCTDQQSQDSSDSPSVKSDSPSVKSDSPSVKPINEYHLLFGQSQNKFQPRKQWNAHSSVRNPSVTPVKNTNINSKIWTPSSARQLFSNGELVKQKFTGNQVSPANSAASVNLYDRPSSRQSQNGPQLTTEQKESASEESIQVTASLTGSVVSSRSASERAPHCVGCTGTTVCGDTQLNSRTINIVLETSPFTCKYHRKQRDVERKYINKIRKSYPVARKQTVYMDAYNNSQNGKKKKMDVYDFSTDSNHDDYLSPPNSDLEKGIRILSISNTKQKGTHHRQRVPYTEEEENNLIHGVKTLGKFWNQILSTYKFDPSRTAVDLKDKYKNIQKQTATENKRCTGGKKSVPFSMCEERRLLKGIKLYGYNWKTILQSFIFHPDRTAIDLRTKWRSMHKQINSRP